MDDLTRRVEALETKVDKTNTTVERLEREFMDFKREFAGFKGAFMDFKLEVKTELAELRGRMSQIPTIWTYLTVNTALVFTVIGVTLAMVKFLKP